MRPPKITAKQHGGYAKAYREGITVNDGYNVPTYGITSALYAVIGQCLREMTGSGHPHEASTAEINRYLAGSKLGGSRADDALVGKAREALARR